MPDYINLLTRIVEVSRSWLKDLEARKEFRLLMSSPMLEDIQLLGQNLYRE